MSRVLHLSKKFSGDSNHCKAEQEVINVLSVGKETVSASPGRKEIRELTGNGLPYRSREELEVALSPHFDILYSEEELIPLSFEDPIKVLYHLKQTGVNGLSTQSSPTGKQENDLCSSDNNSKNNFKNNLPQQQWTRRDLQLFCERYMQEFTQGTSVSLTYHPIYIIAKKKKV